MFKVIMGKPGMQDSWDELKKRVKRGTATKDEKQLYSKIGKAMSFLSRDPGHPGLASHEIGALSNFMGFKVWQSYLENNTPAAGRMFWAYGPDKDEITILGAEPHPNTKSNSYRKIKLSGMESPKEVEDIIRKAKGK